MSRGAVVECEGRRETTLAQSHQHRPPFLLSIIMRTACAAHESKAVVECPIRHAKRIRQAVLEPAYRAGADAGHHDPRVPRRAQDFVESVQAPHGEHVRAAAAADVDHVLIHHERFEVANVALEKGQMSRRGARWWERFVKAPDVHIAVAAGRSDEAYARTLSLLAPREAQDKVVESRIA